MAAGDGSRLTAREGRRFAWTVGAAFALLALVERWRARPSVAVVLGGVAIAWLVAGAVLPTRLGGVKRGWTRLGDALSWVTRPIVLGILYWLVLTPVGIARRSFGRSPIARPPDGATYWARRERVSPADARRSMERMF